MTAMSIPQIVANALAEDAPRGDVTAETLLGESVHANAQLVSREQGVFAGAEVVRLVFEQVGAKCEMKLEDGSPLAPGTLIAEVSGPARSVLRGERIALNFAQRLSGIATQTKRFVDATAGTKAKITDTRKTTPGLRELERLAVRAGGGVNHRFSLSDRLLAKDNHLALIDDITAALIAARKKLPAEIAIEVEVDRIDQIEPVLSSGVVDVIMLDNFDLANLRRGVEVVNGRAIVEASGGVNLETVGEIAQTGVDVISVGSLTHSVKSLDLALDINIKG